MSFAGLIELRPSKTETVPHRDNAMYLRLVDYISELTTGENRGKPIVFAPPLQITRLNCSYCGYAGNREGSCPKCGASE